MISDIEIHMTISDLEKEKINEFESFCQLINAKPIIIELSEGKYYRQPMISKVIKCGTKTKLEGEISKLKNSFITKGYDVVRTKIEVAPWHKKNVENYFQDKTKTYYEWHGKVLIKDEDLIKSICEKYEAKLSRNSLKSDIDRKFITMREENDEEKILLRIQNLKQDLSSYGIKVIKEELEYCIYDSNKSLDKGWIN